MKKLLVSFSGGETSAYMAQWLKKHKSEEYEMVFVFANTGQENEETLEFIEKCDKAFSLNVVWVEAVFHKEHRKGTTHKIVNFESACRDHSLFEEMIKVYGIPNQSYPHCNRELKLQAIKSYMRSIGWKDYWTAIGIRNDEIDRVNKDRKKNKLYYPLVIDRPMTKSKINFWWSKQEFRLNLKHYQGNCKTCWKKSDNKLYQIAKESPKYFEVFDYLEEQYKDYIPESRDQSVKGVHFFRRNRSAKDILRESKDFKGIITDDSANINYQSSLFDYEESCDIFAECGIDN